MNYQYLPDVYINIDEFTMVGVDKVTSPLGINMLFKSSGSDYIRVNVYHQTKGFKLEFYSNYINYSGNNIIGKDIGAITKDLSGIVNSKRGYK